MKPIQLELFPGRKRSLMYQKSEAAPDTEGRKSRSAGPGLEGESLFQTGESLLCKVRPDIFCGEAFTEQARLWCESRENFLVMVIRVDPAEDPPGPDEKARPSAAMSAAAQALQEICESRSGAWGALNADCLCCFLPTVEDDAFSSDVEKIRERVKTVEKSSVAVGVACFPSLSYEKTDMVDNAVKSLDHALLLGPDGFARFDAVTLNISGDNLYQKGDIDGAVEEFKNALLIDPENVNVINSLGVCHGVKGEHDKAIEEFTKAMGFDPGDVMAPYNLGLSYVMTGEKDKALEFLLKAFALDENQFEVALQLGRLYLDRQEPETALEYLEKAVKMDKESAPAHRFLGECHNDLKRTPEAIRCYSEAVKLNGNDAYSLSALGVLYAEQGKNLDIALVFCEQSVDLAPETALFHHRMGLVCQRLERFQEALEAFRRAGELGHDSESQIRLTRERLAETAPDRETRQ